MKFLLDEHVSPKVADILRGKGVDVISLPNDLHGASDHEVLMWAASNSRCVVTANVADFIELSKLFYRNDMRHAGVLCIQGSIPTRRFDLIADVIADYAKSHPDEIYEYLVDFVATKDHLGGLRPGD